MDFHHPTTTPLHHTNPSAGTLIPSLSSTWIFHTGSPSVERRATGFNERRELVYDLEHNPLPWQVPPPPLHRRGESRMGFGDFRLQGTVGAVHSVFCAAFGVCQSVIIMFAMCQCVHMTIVRAIIVIHRFGFSIT